MKKTFSMSSPAANLLKSMVMVVCLGFLYTTAAHAQGSVPCPPNIDFNNGDLSNWICFTGQSTTGSTGNPVQATSMVQVAPIGGAPLSVARQSVTSGTNLDYYGGFPVVAPGGSPYSLLLGDTTRGAKATRVRYYVHVPVAMNDYSFNFRFAVVLEDVGHPREIQPAFTIQAYDSALAATTGVVTPLACAQQNYVASAQLIPLGFKNSKKAPYSGDTIRYLSWTGSALPLIGQGGKTIVIEVTALDCSAGGHFGYGYFDVISCGKYKAAVSYCNLDSGIVRFIGTGITQTYNWYTSNWQFVGSGPYVDVPIPNTPDFFWGVLANGSPGCLDTIKTDTVANFTLNTVPKMACIQFGTPINLSTTVVGGLTGSTYNYAWSGVMAASTLTCLNCQNPVATPYDTTTYYVNVTDRIGCFRNDTVHVNQAPNAGP
ncbi:MAG: hypothetical protein JST27_04360, partial [Bacteroidetes bacterium]|nr:hypothetical protein [Bacteroidota bacterium]